MLRALLISAGLSLLPALAGAAEAGKVVFAIGKVQVAAKPAVLQQAVQEGDELVTGADGYIYMKTVDEGFLILRPNSRARVVAYRIDKVNPANSQVKLELLQGVARSISGDGVKRARNNFRFNTPVAAIGVRGTDFIVYTNDQSSWVSVVSGGVVMSGFAGACGREGTGPCEGVSSRELFAGRADAMLQVKRGEQAPQLLQGATVAPEINVQPRIDEPVGKVVGGAKLGAAPLIELNLDPSKAVTLKPNDKPEDKPVGPNLPVQPVPPVPVPEPEDPLTPIPVPDPGPQDPVVVLPEPPPPPTAPVVKSEVLWGRWQAVAGAPATPEQIAKINAEAKKVKVTLGSYTIARPDNSAFVLPREGTVGYTLGDSEAVLGKKGGPLVAAKVQDASLNIDFSKRAYTTSFTVVNEIGQAKLSSYGDITKTGTMVSASASQGVSVRGVLGGTDAAEAIYTFKTPDDALIRAQGITTWSRN